MVSIVNMVGAGILGVELNLSSVAEDIRATDVNYDEENYPGLYLQLKDSLPKVTLYRTGSYHISGATSKEELLDARRVLIHRLSELGLELDEEHEFSVRNVVCVADVDDSLDLNALTLHFGMENIEYEPEQFPGLVYRPDSFDAVVLLFASGKAVITGASDTTVAEKVFESVLEDLPQL